MNLYITTSKPFANSFYSICRGIWSSCCIFMLMRITKNEILFNLMNIKYNINNKWKVTVIKFILYSLLYENSTIWNFIVLYKFQEVLIITSFLIIRILNFLFYFIRIFPLYLNLIYLGKKCTLIHYTQLYTNFYYKLKLISTLHKFLAFKINAINYNLSLNFGICALFYII